MNRYEVICNINIAIQVEANDAEEAREMAQEDELPAEYVEDSFDIVKVNKWTYNKYMLEVTHDEERFNVWTTASDDETAIRKVAKMENCPESAVKIQAVFALEKKPV